MTVFKRIVTLVFFITPRAFRHKIRDFSSDGFIYFIQRNVSKKQINKHANKNKGRVLEEKLWGGFSLYALQDLLLLRDDNDAKSRDRDYAAWALARWYACHVDHLKALENVILMRELCTWKNFDLSQVLLEADCLIQLHRYQQAKELLEGALNLKPENPQLLLSLANCFLKSDDISRLNTINKIYQNAGFKSIELTDDKQPLNIENVKVNVAISSDENGIPNQPLVTVIMPVYNAEETLHIAIDSLLAQTWKGLEIIIVDDCSSDDTFSVAQRYAGEDARVRAYQLGRNQGAYTARNYALSVATGEFVTTHDADDWSHPQKIETQVRHLLESVEYCDANVTHWVRVYPNLEFRGTSRPTNHLIQWNHSSLMMRRELLLSLGGWDSVRITGDTELIWRLEALTERKIVRLYKHVPLSFALEDPSSLTRQGNSHVWTIHYGVRREYREMADYWHQHAEKESLRNLSAPGDGGRVFPAPGFIQADKKLSRSFNALIVMDCSKVGKEHEYNINILKDYLNIYETVGVFHWPHYLTDVKAPINSEIRDLALSSKLSIVVSGEVINAPCIIASNTLALGYKIDRPPKIIPKKFKVIVNELALDTIQAYKKFTPEQIEDNVRELFDCEVEWMSYTLDEREYIPEIFGERQISSYPKFIARHDK